MSEKATITVQAAKGCMLPLHVNGKKIRITDEKSETILVKNLTYESKVVLCDALESKLVAVAKEPAAAKGDK
ncbi:hypothetical protein [Bdellovibrio bacteriovorus]|uniref:hypothetical protein n=1 Tax=Bdellovibrio bacteriovorus TaxID=959 RepID=UPI003AA99564